MFISAKLNWTATVSKNNHQEVGNPPELASRNSERIQKQYHPDVELLDLEIIKVLQKDARASFRDIARQLNVAVGTVQSRVKKMELNNTIKGFSVDLDYSKLGYSLTALIQLQAKGRHLKEVERKLAKYDAVCVVYDLTGDFDIAVIAKFVTSPQMDRFIKEVLSIEFVERSVTSIVLNSVKENYNIPII